MNKILSCLLLSLVISACSDSAENPVIVEESWADFLTTDSWKMVSFVEEGVEKLKQCDKDDEYFFNKDFTYLAKLGVLCMGQPNVGDISGSWVMNEKDSTIDITQAYSGIYIGSHGKFHYVTKDSFKAYTETNFPIIGLKKVVITYHKRD